MVDIELIKQRKAVYGDNFECIADMWSEFLKGKLGITKSFRGLNGKDVAEMMALLKECRIDTILKKYEFCGDEELAKKLKEALTDSLKDRDNYEWIAENYEKYKRLWWELNTQKNINTMLRK